ncbi:hypothetical protein PGQ11_001370 [Apiospora arundinis]|uniref:Uncharacterized protein n=1 Tax=Apiospora arundinis TaxID=335852 RepID=A0ABR2JMQ4_9PEZI
MPPATTGQGETTTTTQVSQGENPKFELTLQTRTCFGNRSYGAFPLEHVGRCIAPEEEGEEVVVAHIQLVFYMVVDSSPHKFTGVWDHALSIKTNDIRNQEYNRLPTLPEAEDRENAADMMQWGRDFPRTKEEGGIVPYVKGMLKRMVRNTYAYHESERTADGKPSWSEVKDSFDESIRPLDEDLVIGALVGALAQVRQDCEMYDMVRGGITIG